MRPLTVTIQLDNLRHNYKFLKNKHGGKVLAVVKANAYGHGAIQCARALTDIADGFAVAFLAEAVELREAGVTKPILILEGALESNEYATIDKYNLWTVIQNEEQLTGYLSHNWHNKIKVWLKLDTGMHRLGFTPENYIDAFQKLNKYGVADEILKMSHFACSDDLESNKTREQLAVFDDTGENQTAHESIANSAAILTNKNSYRDWGS